MSLIYPELENDPTRSYIIREMLTEFPSVRLDVIKWLKDEFAGELK